MRLKYTTRKGRFNFCDTSEESFSCHVAVYDKDGEKLKYINIKTEYDENGSDLGKAIELIGEQKEAVFFSTSEKEWDEMIEFLKIHQDEIEEGNRQYRITELTKEIDDRQNELKALKR
jgi:hypothetical protein